MELTDNVTEVIKIIVDATSDAVVEKMKPVIEGQLCEDAISRQAVLDIFGLVMDYWKEHAIDVEPHEIEDALIKQYEFTAKKLSELPPIYPKSKVGKWIRQQSYSGYTHTYECSECGRTIYAEDDDLTDFPYCHCGVKMEVADV